MSRPTPPLLLAIFLTTLLASLGRCQAGALRAPLVARGEATGPRIAAALDDVRRNIVPRCWRARCTTDRAYRKRYLAKWQAIHSEHFLLFANGPRATCRSYPRGLEQLYATIQKELPFAEPEHLMPAFVFQSEEEYVSFAVNVSGMPEGVARATTGHATTHYWATVFRSPRDPVMFHEATHTIIKSCLGIRGVGSWFQEGLAVYFTDRMTNGKTAGDVRSEIRRGDFRRLQHLIGMQRLMSDPTGDGPRNYRHAGALIDFLMHSDQPAVRGRFPRFVTSARIGHGIERGLGPARRLFRKVYGLDIDEVERLWLRHLRIDPDSIPRVTDEHRRT